MLHVITGGSGSGKSAYAENWLLEQREKNLYDENSENTNPSAPLYIATMIPYGKEGETKVIRHRRLRAGKGFRTFECYRDLAKADIPVNTGILLECMSNLTANEIYQEGGAGDNTVKAILNGIHHLLEQAGNLVVVTNEVFSDGITYDPETEKYLEKLGAINCQMAQIADTVTEVVYGIPIFHKKTGEERKNEEILS